MTTIEVGHENGVKKTFYVYRGLLCFHSTYFNKLLNGSFKEGGSDNIRLKDVSIDTFQAFFCWLNTGKLHPPSATISLDWQEIMEVYVFGDANMIPRLKNAAIDLYVTKIYQDHILYSSGLDYLYSHTTSGDALRKLAVDSAVEKPSWVDIEKYRERYPLEFLVDVMIVLRDKRVTVGSSSQSIYDWYKTKKDQICNYHDHSEPNEDATRKAPVGSR
jgi:hypothetical protein